MVARDLEEEKQGRRLGKRVFPGKKGQVRMILREEGCLFEFEARRWGKDRDGT